MYIPRKRCREEDVTPQEASWMQQQQLHSVSIGCEVANDFSEKLDVRAMFLATLSDGYRVAEAVVLTRERRRGLRAFSFLFVAKTLVFVSEYPL